MWERILDWRDGPPAIALATAGAALVVVLVSGLWRPARNVITIVHEAGHAVVAVLVGRRLTGIRLHSDTSGLTLTRGKPYGPGMVCTLLAGYLSPSLLGLAFAGILEADLLTAPLVVGAALLLGVLLFVRNAYGVLSVLVSGAVLVGVSWLGTAEVKAAFAQLITWFLLLGGIRPVGELQGKRRRGAARDSDADQLARLTGAPAFFWVASFLLIALACLLLSANWLLLP